MSQQTYFWACVTEDGSVLSEYNPDGSENYYPNIPEQTRNDTRLFGLTCSKHGFFFDLVTGEFHRRAPDEEDVVYPLPIKSMGSSKYEFYQYKEGHTDVNMASLETSENIIDRHVIGMKGVRNGLTVDAKFSLDPSQVPVQPKLEITVKEFEDGEPMTIVYNV